jgi:hypothetical protein
MTRTLEISAIRVETTATEKITSTTKVATILLTSTRWVRITKTKDTNIKTLDVMMTPMDMMTTTMDMVMTTMDRQAMMISGTTTMITTSVA